MDRTHGQDQAARPQTHSQRVSMIAQGSSSTPSSQPQHQQSPLSRPASSRTTPKRASRSSGLGAVATDSFSWLDQEDRAILLKASNVGAQWFSMYLSNLNLLAPCLETSNQRDIEVAIQHLSVKFSIGPSTKPVKTHAQTCQRLLSILKHLSNRMSGKAKPSSSKKKPRTEATSDMSSVVVLTGVGSSAPASVSVPAPVVTASPRVVLVSAAPSPAFGLPPVPLPVPVPVQPTHPMDFASFQGVSSIRDLLANTRIPKRPYPPAVHQHVYPMAYPTVSQAPHPPVHQTVPPQALNTTRTSLSNGYQFNATAAPVTSATPATFSPALAATSASTAPYVHPHARQRYPPQPEKRNSKKNKKPNSNHNHSKKRKSGPRPPFPFPKFVAPTAPSDSEPYLLNNWRFISRCRTPYKLHSFFDLKAYVESFELRLATVGHAHSPGVTNIRFPINQKVFDALKDGNGSNGGTKTRCFLYFFTTFKNLDLSHFTVSAGIFGRNQFQCTESIDGFPLIDVTKPFLEDVSTFHVRPPEFELKIATRMATSDKSRVVGCVMLLNELNRADRLAKVYESTLRLHEDYSKPLPLGFTIAPDVSRDVSLLKERLIEVRHYRKPQKGPPGERVILSDDENHNGQTQARVEMEDIEIGDTVVSFSCLISLSRIEHPARGKHCRHPQCFDAKVFLQMASLNVTWKCGVCNEFIFPQDLIIDASFLNLLLKYPDADKCTLLADGTDMPYQPSLSTTIDVTGDAPGNMNRKRKRGRSDEVICILDDHSDNDLEDGELSGNESDASHLTISSTGSASRRRSRKRKNKPSFFTEDANGVLILD